MKAPLYSRTYSESAEEFRHRVENHKGEGVLERCEPEHQPAPREVIAERPWSDVVRVLVGVQSQLRNYGTPEHRTFGGGFTAEQYAMFGWAAELLDQAINEAKRLSLDSEHTNDRS